MTEEDNYQALRQKNIEERNAIFAEFFKDLKKIKKEEIDFSEARQNTEDTENEPPRKRRRSVSSKSDTPRKNRVRLEFRKVYNTRNRVRHGIGNFQDDLDDQESIDDSKSYRPKLQILFPWAKPMQREIDLMKIDVGNIDRKEEEQYDDNDIFEKDYKNRKVYKVSKSPYDPDSIPSVDEITQDMLDNVAERSTLKVYCKVNGTSCHQCRQKTLDTKTLCRSGECIGVRGSFCGPCLRGRYGESAVEALKDPNWICPPCRGLCNCSICRTRSGLPPTGILAPVVQEKGYSSVMDYLQVTEDGDT